MKITRNQTIIAVVILLIGLYFFITNRKRTSTSDEVPTADVIAADLENMKYHMLNGTTTEKYRSDNSTSHTIAGTTLEQVIDIIVAILNQDGVKKILDTAIQKKEDAVAIADMIEAVGKDVVNSINSNQIVNSGGSPNRGAMENIMKDAHKSVRDEIDNKPDTWYPILSEFAKNHGDKLGIKDNKIPDKDTAERGLLSQWDRMKPGQVMTAIASGPPPSGGKIDIEFKTDEGQKGNLKFNDSSGIKDKITFRPERSQDVFERLTINELPGGFKISVFDKDNKAISSIRGPLNNGAMDFRRPDGAKRIEIDRA